MPTPKARVTVRVTEPDGTLIDSFVVESTTDASTPVTLANYIRATLDNMPYLVITDE